MNDIERLRPRFSLSEAAEIARELYDIAGTAKSLPSERDQNFLLAAASKEKFVLKISNRAETRTILHFQNQAMAHLAHHMDPGLFPQVLPDRAGQQISAAVDARGHSFQVRLLTHLVGRPLVEFIPHSKRLFYELGHFLGSIDVALTTLDHAPPKQDLLWDLNKAAAVIGSHMSHIIEPERQTLVGRFLDLFESKALPRLSQLRTSVIHNDANDHNVLVSPDAQITGIIDFGDMHHSYTVYELAIALSYAMLNKVDPLSLGSQIVSGYHERLPLTDLEIELLYPMIVARLCTSVSLSAMRRQKAPENDYLTISEQPAWLLLEQLQEVGPAFSHYIFRHACHMAPCPQTQSITQWISDNSAEIAPILDCDLSQALTIDLSAGSLDLGGISLSDPAALIHSLPGPLAGVEAEVVVGRYNEARLIYQDDKFRVANDQGEEWRTVHLGLDLFVRAGTVVHAPLAGFVHSFHDNAGTQDYGPTIILEHRTEFGTFFTLYGHLGRLPLDDLRPGMPIQRGEPFATIGDRSVNGGWPPHLHFQLITDLLGRHGEFPGVARPSQRQVWLSISPDPKLLLPSLPFEPAQTEMDPDDILEIRHRHLGKSLTVSYQKPLKIVRGWQQYLYDELGQRYLDGVNNVCHVGHCHPHVVKSLRQQSAVLNTNTRYLHDNLARYAQRLCATLPEPLSVCFFVCSGSEANELALRLARTFTNQRDTVVLDGAYHGNTSALIEISPYKFGGPGGSGPSAYVHAVPMPDSYRGRHRSTDEDLGHRYAQYVQQAIRSLQAQGRGLGAFICEALLGCGGQIVLPDNYLSQVFQYVRAAGGVCIADEVQVGFGRVGSHFWGFQTQDVVPDIVTMGKPIGNGHPLAAVVTTPEIAASFANGMEYFNTFGGNPVSCAVGMAVMDVIERESLQQNAYQVGKHLKEQLKQLQASHTLIGDVRGLGLFLGIELTTDAARRKPAGSEAKYVVERMRDHGILISSDGPDHNVLKIKPPMVFTRENAERLVTTLDKVLAESHLNQL